MIYGHAGTKKTSARPLPVAVMQAVQTYKLQTPELFYESEKATTFYKYFRIRLFFGVLFLFPVLGMILRWEDLPGSSNILVSILSLIVLIVSITGAVGLLGVSVITIITTMLAPHEQLYVCPQGLLRYRYRRHAVEVIRWDEIMDVDFVKNDYFIDDDAPIPHGHIFRYTLRRRDNTMFEFSDETLPREKYEALVHIVEREFTLRHLPAAISAYEEGSTVMFGPISVDQEGIYYDGGTYSWREVSRIVVYEDILSIRDYSGSDEYTLSPLSFATRSCGVMANYCILIALVDYIKSNQFEDVIY